MPESGREGRGRITTFLMMPDATWSLMTTTNAVITTTEAEASVTVSFDLGGSRFVQIDFTPLKGNNKLAQYFMAAIQFGK